MEKLYELFTNSYNQIEIRFVRYFHDKINWESRLSVIVGAPDMGNIRETFFLRAMSVNQRVLSSPVSDFLIDGYTFEVGGKSKKQKQIKNVQDAFVVKDDVENPYLNILPLWTFGMNY